jgi:hypothetical protein
MLLERGAPLEGLLGNVSAEGLRAGFQTEELKPKRLVVV